MVLHRFDNAIALLLASREVTSAGSAVVDFGWAHQAQQTLDSGDQTDEIYEELKHGAMVPDVLGMDEDDALGPFDPKNHCVKCGYVIPDPVAPAAKMGPDGKPIDMGPPPPPTPPNVTYCDGINCPWYDDVTDEEDAEEHMHAVCTVCHYEWLTKTLDAG